MHDKVKKLAKERGISITNLEKELGIGNGTIGKWRESSPNVETLAKVAQYFGVSMDYFIGNEKK